jgi:ATP-dependent protease ClpP protease subunit
MLKRCPAQKTVYVDGLAASIASVIAMAGDKIVMPSNAFLMIHKAWNIAMGNADDMRKMADDLDTIDEGILNVYADNMKDGTDINDIKNMVSNETWLNGKDAANYFNIDVTEGNKAAASISNLSNYKNVPQELVQAAAPPEDPDGKETAEMELLKAKLALECA